MKVIIYSFSKIEYNIIFEKLYGCFFNPKIKKTKNLKNVRFSEINQVYLIHTIDEIKEYLPEMYWNFEKNSKLNNEIFLPLKRQTFVYELSKKNTNMEMKYLPL
jgi:hypothetical protein